MKFIPTTELGLFGNPIKPKLSSHGCDSVACLRGEGDYGPWIHVPIRRVTRR